MISPTVKTPHTVASPRSKGVHVQVIATPRQIASLFGNSGNSKMQRPSTTFEILQRLNGNYYRPTWQALPEEISLSRVSSLVLIADCDPNGSDNTHRLVGHECGGADAV